MPSIINAATSGGLISTADTSGVLQLQTASTTALTIDGSQNVGIGTASVIGTGPLEVVRNANSGNTRVLVSNSNSGSSAASYFLFGNDSAAAGFGGVRSSSSTNTSFGGTNAIQIFNNLANVSFSTAGVERMNIPVAGGVQAVTTISVGNATPSSSGAGITFPATQSASSDANTLDDYEEGTFTPAYSPSSGSFTTLTYAYQDGKYTKIGNVVYCQIDMATSAVTVGTASSQVKITGLPFAPSRTARGFMNQCNNWSGGTPPDAAAVSTGSFLELGINNYYQNASCNVSDMSTQTATRNEVHANFFYYIS
jgi:hypothetical protein